MSSRAASRRRNCFRALFAQPPGGQPATAPGLDEASGAVAPANRLAVAVTIVGLFAYWLLVDRIGFLVAASALLVALMSAYRVRLALAVPISLVAALLVHTAFFKLLKVPLPWGVLAPVAW